MPARNSSPSTWLVQLTLAAVVFAGSTQAADDFSFEQIDRDSAALVNEGPLNFLITPPARAVHHHQNHIRILPGSLTGGWVELSQCHENLDAVPRMQITFREGYVRNLKVVSATLIDRAWVEGASVQLTNIRSGARLCLSALTRALRNTGNGYFNLTSGPYMRKFLDGYYPMRVSLSVDYPPTLLKLIDISPPSQTGLRIAEQAGKFDIDAMFEGELTLLVQFDRPHP